MIDATNSRTRFSLFTVTWVLFLLHSTMPLVGFYTPGWVYLLETLLMWFFVVFNAPGKMNRYLAFLLPLFLLTIMQSLPVLKNSDLYSFFLFLYGELQVLVFPAFALFFIDTENEKSTKSFVLLALITYGITALTTYVGCLRFPDAARLLATDLETTDSDYITFCKNNIAGFIGIYSITLLFPILIGFWKEKRLKTWLFVPVLLIFTFCIIESGYATALLFLFLSLPLLFISGKFDRKKNIKLAVLCAVLIVLVYSFLPSLLETISSWFSQSAGLEERLLSLADLLRGEEASGDLKTRLSYYQSSWNSFLSSPIIGTMFIDAVSNGHSFILDFLSLYGLLGGFVLFLIYRKIYLVFYKPYENESFYGYLLFAYVGTIFMAIANSKANWHIIGCIVPLCGYYLKQSKENEESNTDESALDY